MGEMPDKSRIGTWPFDSKEFIEGKCLLCDNPATAFWHGRADILICEKCAVWILPRLIVDAICEDHLHESIEKINTSFVQAAQARDEGLGRTRRNNQFHEPSN